MRHELYIDCGDAEENLALLRSIESQREAFEGSYGRALSFEELPEGQAMADLLRMTKPFTQEQLQAALQRAIAERASAA